MSATEIIEEIKRLSPEERSKVVEFVRHLPNQETLEAMKEAQDPEKLESYSSAKEMFKAMGIRC